jgi:hypothetical protein
LRAITVIARTLEFYEHYFCLLSNLVFIVLIVCWTYRSYPFAPIAGSSSESAISSLGLQILFNFIGHFLLFEKKCVSAVPSPLAPEELISDPASGSDEKEKERKGKGERKEMVGKIERRRKNYAVAAPTVRSPERILFAMFSLTPRVTSVTASPSLDKSSLWLRA